MTRRDSRARPPPIRVETSSPPKAMTLLPAVQVNGHHDHDHHDHGHGSHAHGNGCSHGHGNGHGNGNGHSHSHDDDADEEKDNVGDLPPTPSRHSFHGASLAALMGERPTTPTRESGRPSSPSSPWSPLEAATSPARRTQPLARPPSWHRNSLEVPSFVGAEPRRFEPTPTHGLHARNLSTYFPHPGVPLPPASPTLEGAEQVIPQGDRTAFGGPQDWQFGESPTGEMEGGEQMRRGKRRGHHVSTSREREWEA
jgi:hypothetical protein